MYFSVNKQQWKYLISYLDSVGEDAIVSVKLIFIYNVGIALPIRVEKRKDSYSKTGDDGMQQ